MNIVLVNISLLSPLPMFRLVSIKTHQYHYIAMDEIFEYCS
jgi:hypothetical protein